MKTYRGARTFDAIVVTVDDAPLQARRDLHLYSRNGFEWGFEGAESTQLALAIVADATDDALALTAADSFMRAIVANFDNEWEIDEEQVRTALRDLQSL